MRSKSSKTYKLFKHVPMLYSCKLGENLLGSGNILQTRGVLLTPAGSRPVLHTPSPPVREIKLRIYTCSNLAFEDMSFKTLLFPDIYHITKRRLYNFDPLKPHFYIVKLGFTGVYIIFLISAQKHRLWVLVRTASLRQF